MDKQHTKIFTSFSGQLFFYDDDADAQRQVIGNFKKLRNIIMNLNTQDKFLEYITEQTVKSEHIQSLFDTMPLKEKLQSQDTHVNSKHYAPHLCTGKYIQIITCITLQFIMGQSVSTSGDKHNYYRSQKINATACEFMELMLKSLQKKQPELLTEISHLIIYPLS